MPKFKTSNETDVNYIVTIKRTVRPAQFKNLWSMTMTNYKGEQEETIVDNDTLQICLDKIGYVMENDGF